MKKVILSAVVMAVIGILVLGLAHAFNKTMPLYGKYYESGADKTTVVSLMYHQLTDEPSDIGAFVVYPETFENDIAYLKQEGYEFCFASEVDDIFKGEKPAGKYVVLTFDDGYESDFYYTVPILEKYNAKATIFVTGALIGSGDHITREHLAEIAKSDFVEIGNHSYELHIKTAEKVRKMYKNNEAEKIVDDFKHNAEYLESIIGKKITTLSYPYGMWTKSVDESLRKLGYEKTFSSDEIPVKNADSPCGRLNRYYGADIVDLVKIQLK